jgi:hypothetical protein
MELPQSVQLYKHFGTDPLGDRIQLSDGTCPAAPFSREDAKYMPHAYVPRPPWRSLTTEESNVLITEQPPKNISNSITLLRVPDAIMQPFKNLWLGRNLTRQEFYEAVDGSSGQEAIKGAADFVRTLILKEDEFRIIRIYNQPGLYSTGYRPEIDSYVGLHVDSWDRQPIDARENVTNRISINIGNEDRFLVYMNLTMKDLIEILNPPLDCSPNDLVLGFFQMYPKYPAIRVRIRPGEAYIAPTENIIHDGIGSKLIPDFNLTICGHIGIPQVLFQEAP